MKSIHIPLTLVAVSALVLTGCTSRTYTKETVYTPAPAPTVVQSSASVAPPIVVDTPPPPPRTEAPPPAPSATAVWAPGYWSWNNGQYEWVAGHWEVSQAGYSWVPHRWENVNGRWQLTGGAWVRQ